MATKPACQGLRAPSELASLPLFSLLPATSHLYPTAFTGLPASSQMLLALSIPSSFCVFMIFARLCNVNIVTTVHAPLNAIGSVPFLRERMIESVLVRASARGRWNVKLKVTLNLGKGRTEVDVGVEVKDDTGVTVDDGIHGEVEVEGGVWNEVQVHV